MDGVVADRRRHIQLMDVNQRYVVIAGCGGHPHTVVSLSTCIYSTEWPLCQEDIVEPVSNNRSSVVKRRGPPRSVEDN